jgi:hypothetical protein
MHIPALRSADHRDAPLSSTEDGDQLACPLPTLAGSHTSDGWRESDVSYFGHYGDHAEIEIVLDPDATRPRHPGRACGPLRRSAGAHLPVFTHIGPDSKYTRGSV